MTGRRALSAVLYSALLLGLAWGCASSNDSSSASAGAGGGNDMPDAGLDGTVVEPDGPTSDGGSFGLNPLCGEVPPSTCLPDDTTACDSYSPPLTPSLDGTGGQGGDNGEGGASQLASEAGGSSSATGGSGSSGSSGSAGAAGEAGASTQGGAAGAPGMPVAKFSCQVRRSTTDASSVVSDCQAVGQGAANAPCLSAADCQAGYGCVGDQSSGLCQKYCCGDTDKCDTGTYCAERPLRDAVSNAIPKGSTDSSSTLLIPVCVPAENCDLGAPYPCTSGTQCACASGTACLVVRSDGTTTCAVPGAGKVGDACPCAWGHVCSAAKNQCLKLCYTRGAASCGDGRCQSATELPDGWGVCVGSTTGD